MTPALVYLLCAVTSVLCSALLYRSHRRSRTRLLFWSAVCFFGLALNNVLLFVDHMLGSLADLSVVRTLPAVIGFGALVWGFAWEDNR